MEQTKVKAIVIASSDYKEKDKLVTLFSLEQGVISVLFKSVKNSNAKLKAAKEIMTFGEFIFTDGNFKTVTSVEIIDSFYDITKNIKKYYCICAIFNIVKTVLSPGIVDAGLFLDTLKVLKGLAYSDASSLLVLCKFMISLFEKTGYKLSLGTCSCCGEKLAVNKVFNFSNGDITCFRCRSTSSVDLSGAQYGALRLISMTEFEKLNTLKISENTLKEVYDILAKNFAYRFNKKLEIDI